MGKQVGRLARFSALIVAGVAGLLLAGCHGGPHVSFVVDATVDAPDASPGDGVCASAAGDCTLRAAIMEANSLPAGTAGEVVLAGETYVLTLLGGDAVGAIGDLDVDTEQLTIVGNGSTIEGPPQHRALRLVEHHSGSLIIRDATLRGGHTDSVIDFQGEGEAGGAILNHASLTIEDVVVTGSMADEGGAGIHQTSGSTTVLRSRVVSNSGAPFGDPWAAIAVDSGSLTVVESEVASSRGFCVAAGRLTWCSNVVAGIRQAAGTATILQSTVADHTSCCDAEGDPYPGTGLDTDGSATIVLSTFAGNADDLAGTGTVSLAGSVLSSCSLTATSSGYNVDADGSCHGATHESDVVDAGVVLGPLAFNGAATQNMLPVAGSSAVDLIPSGVAGLCDGTHTWDQRHQPRPAGAGCDAGSAERQASDP